MSAETQTGQFSERVIRQVRLDSTRAMVRARFCPQRSEVLHLRCVDQRAESEHAFGCQLWFFEGIGVDDHESRQLVYGVLEYSVQFGLHELVEDAVFESEGERDRFQSLYRQQSQPPSWRQPAHRWLLVGMICVAFLSLAFLMFKKLTA